LSCAGFGGILFLRLSKGGFTIFTALSLPGGKVHYVHQL
jgi:hypothetical protein